MNKLVSVIIPTHNFAEYISESIDSVLAQTYRGFEIIIVDDGSTDNTKEVVEKWGQSDKVRYFYQENKGPGAARNRGIKESKGDYIAFLDADDLWLPEKLKKQMDKFNQSPELGFIHTDYVLFNENGTMQNRKFGIKSKKNLSGHIFPYLLRECFVRTSTVMLRKECFEKIGFFEEAYLSEDYDFLLRLSKEYQAGYVDETMAKCREHIKQAHLNIEKTYESVENVINKTLKRFPELENDREIRTSLNYRKAKTRFELGYNLFCQNKLKQAREKFVESIKSNFTTQALAYYTLSFLSVSALSALKTFKRRTQE